jgi:hypothetical protein
MKANRLAITLLILIGLAATSCSGPKKQKLESSGDIPAAEATVEIGTSSNGNTTFDLTVWHLAMPSRVDPGAIVYVVWLRSGVSTVQVQNMGALRVDDDLEGNYSGVTPLRDFEIFVTAEPSAAGVSPTGKALLYTTIAAK